MQSRTPDNKSAMNSCFLWTIFQDLDAFLAVLFSYPAVRLTPFITLPANQTPLELLENLKDDQFRVCSTASKLFFVSDGMFFG